MNRLYNPKSPEVSTSPVGALQNKASLTSLTDALHCVRSVRYTSRVISWQASTTSGESISHTCWSQRTVLSRRFEWNQKVLSLRSLTFLSSHVSWIRGEVSPRVLLLQHHWDQASCTSHTWPSTVPLWQLFGLLRSSLHSLCNDQISIVNIHYDAITT